MKTRNFKKIEMEVTEEFKFKYEKYLSGQGDKASALEDARIDASELIPAGVTGMFDDESLTFRADVTFPTRSAMRIEDCRSIGIRVEARNAGITEIDVLGDNGKNGDARVTIYEVGGVRVADTNGDSVWEEEDEAVFAELLEEEEIEL